MQIKSKVVVIIFRVLLLLGCLLGLYQNSGLSSGALNLQMFNFYTILSNAVCLLFFIFMLIKTISNGISPAPRFKGAITMMITVTFLIYHFVLLPQSFTMTSDYDSFSMADILVHYYTPIMVILDWILFDEKDRYKWYDPFIWLIIPYSYFIYVIIRAEVGGVLTAIGSRYPYYFIDIDAIGVTNVLWNVIILSCVFLFLGYIIYVVNKFHFNEKRLWFGRHVLLNFKSR